MVLDCVHTAVRIPEDPRVSTLFFRPVARVGFRVMENPQIADLLEEIADLIELQGGNHFRIRSYRAAARAVREVTSKE